MFCEDDAVFMNSLPVSQAMTSAQWHGEALDGSVSHCLDEFL
jgi:hypothetical protein